MKVGNINNGFAMQSFGGGKKIKAKQIKKAKTNVKILPRVTNLRSSKVRQPNSQLLRAQFVTQNRINMPQQVVQQQAIQQGQNNQVQQGQQSQQVVPQQVVQQQAIQQGQNNQVQQDQRSQRVVPQQVVQQQAIQQGQNNQVQQGQRSQRVVPQQTRQITSQNILSQGSDFSSNDFEFPQGNEKKIQEQKEIIQEQIFENRGQHLQKCDFYKDAINQNKAKCEKASTFLRKFVKLLEEADDKNLNGIKEKINEILDSQEIFTEEVVKPSNLLYNEIIVSREESPDYELSRESLNDNLRLLNIAKNGKNIIQTIIDKTQNDELKKSINDMKSFFKDDVIQGVEQVFKDLNEVYEFDSKLVDSDIQYREKYTNLIMDFISYKEFEEILPSFNSFLFQDLCEDGSVMFPPVLPDMDLDIDIDELQLHLPQDNQ